MQHKYAMLAILMALTLVATACSGQYGVPNTGATSSASGGYSRGGSSSGGAYGGGGYGSGSGSATSAPAMAAQVSVAQNAKLGSILVAANGMTLYVFMKDTANTSNCYGQCATLWPPLLTSGAPAAGSGLDASKLGTTTRTDGSKQVTYNGRPLYNFSKDKQPGDTNGEKIAGIWFVVSPSGDPVQ